MGDSISILRASTYAAVPTRDHDHSGQQPRSCDRGAWGLTHCSPYLPIPVIVECRDASALVVILQLKYELIHELRCFLARRSTSSKVQLGPIKNVEIFGHTPKNIFGDSFSDGLVPLVKHLIRRCNDNVAPGPIIIALL